MPKFSKRNKEQVSIDKLMKMNFYPVLLKINFLQFISSIMISKDVKLLTIIQFKLPKYILSVNSSIQMQKNLPSSYKSWLQECSRQSYVLSMGQRRTELLDLKNLEPKMTSKLLFWQEDWLKVVLWYLKIKTKKVFL
ncbi:hypothetical protein IMG5_184850 [Ichthyophthirius multifiliis]|uniref:Uncharacterized protein n=1 Tax=Ichthyophthirius multifiliis TaxID=5932 RepID=G0R3E1_ICHMU|nr:hypothetical protein IMG5_184850 [Ichthyophthirius multifiliis]EGR28015.1 hypothetical protein IMG5_184850 [Ichthyophthirius multifiliis]|eukprot:XP_004027360.1 hypothetical protein IMG5_184850 [Ichthyophthirius multifiliis]